MKIFYQNNDNDCGIAVTQTLIFHFQNKQISSCELQNQTNIKSSGISLLDLEKLNQKYGIHLDSYSMDFDEFAEYKTNEYFIIMIDKQDSNHYVIAKKNKKSITLYDTAEGKTKIRYQELKKIYLNIFIKISKITQNNQEPKKLQEDETNIEKISILFLVNISVLIFSIVNAFLMKYNINLTNNNLKILDVIKIVGISLIIYVIFHFGEYLEDLLINLHKKQYSKHFYEKIINSLTNKKNSYFHKLNKNQFLLIKEHINTISTYHSEYINKWLISSFILIILGIYLIKIHIFFLLFLLISFLIQYKLWSLCKNMQEKHFPNLFQSQNKGKELLYSLERFLNLEINLKKLKNLIHKCKENYLEEIENNRIIKDKQSFFTKINNLSNSILYTLMFGTMTYYAKLNFEYLIIANVFYLQINKALSSLIGFYGYKSQYHYSKQIYKQFLNIDNIQKISNKEIKMPKYLELKNVFYSEPGKIIFDNLNLKIYPNTFIYGASGIGKSTLYKLIGGKLGCFKDNIFFDEQPSSKINEKVYKDLFIYQISDSYIEDSFKLEVLNLCPNLQKEIINICDAMEIDLNELVNINNLSSGQKQLLNLLSLLNIKNKILILDEITSHINLENKLKIFKHLMPYIAKNNFLICGEHCPQIKEYFDHSINLEEYVCRP